MKRQDIDSPRETNSEREAGGRESHIKKQRKREKTGRNKHPQTEIRRSKTERVDPRAWWRILF